MPSIRAAPPAPTAASSRQEHPPRCVDARAIGHPGNLARAPEGHGRRPARGAVAAPGRADSAGVTMGRATYAVAVERPEGVREALQRIWRDNLTLGISAEEKFRRLTSEAPDPAPHVLVLRPATRPPARSASSAPWASPSGGSGWMAGRRAPPSSGTSRWTPLTGTCCRRCGSRAWRASTCGTGSRSATGSPTQKAVGVMLRAGFGTLGTVSRHVRVLRHEAYAARLGERPGFPPALARMVARPRVARAAGALADPGRMALDLPRALGAARAFRLGWCDWPDGRVHGPRAAARQEYPVVGVRSAAFLAWRSPGRLARHADPPGRRRPEGLRGRGGGAGLGGGAPARPRRPRRFRCPGGPPPARPPEARRGQRVGALPGRAAGAGPAHPPWLRGPGRGADRGGAAGGPGGPAGAAMASAERWHLFDVDEDA